MNFIQANIVNSNGISILKLDNVPILGTLSDDQIINMNMSDIIKKHDTKDIDILKSYIYIYIIPNRKNNPICEKYNSQVFSIIDMINSGKIDDVRPITKDFYIWERYSFNFDILKFERYECIISKSNIELFPNNKYSKYVILDKDPTYCYVQRYLSDYNKESCRKFKVGDTVISKYPTDKHNKVFTVTYTPKLNNYYWSNFYMLSPLHGDDMFIDTPLISRHESYLELV